MTRTIAACLSCLVLAPVGCTRVDPRCSEYRQELATTSGEVGAADYVQAEAAHVEVEAIEISEEAALLSKRMKTLCQLLWAGRITPERYERGVRRAYEDYRDSRARAHPAPIGSPRPPRCERMR